jgi:hypothetical protein
VRKLWRAVAIAGGLLMLGTTPTLAAQLVQISSDPFLNTTAIDGVTVFHHTEVEPDTFAFGSTIVSTFQVGRFENGGSDDIGFATSRDGGATFSNGLLPGLTVQVDPSSPFERVSDASVAFDAKHKVWMISSIPLLPSTVVPVVFVSRSVNGGTRWTDPVSIPQPVGVKVDLDKNWTACDNTPTSPFFGNCYTEFDNFAQGDVVYMSTSSDGGQNWSVPETTPSKFVAIGGQPLVQPNGTVVVPIEGFSPHDIFAFTSTNGGASWSNPVVVDRIQFHSVAGNLRTSPLPSAEIDGAGRVFVAWEDCAFQPGCSANDIVFSTSMDGTTWSAKARVPIDPVGSGPDHFIPGIAVNRATSGPTAQLGLSYYFYPNANCGKPNTPACQLFSGFISSGDGGATWGGTTTTSERMDLNWLPLTSQGFMVGDYESTSFIGGVAFPVFAVAHAPSGGFLDEAMNTVAGGFAPIAGGSGTSATQSGAAATSTATGAVATHR